MRDLRRFAGSAFLLLFLMMPLASGCDSGTEEETQETVVTRFVLTLTKTDGSGTLDYDVTVQNGTAVDPPIVRVDDGSSYDGTVRVFGRTGGGAETEITDEIRRDGELYQFFYSVLGGVADVARVTVEDEDARGFPLGMVFLMDTADGASGEGTLRIRLARYERGEKSGVAVGDDLRFELVLPLRLTIP